MADTHRPSIVAQVAHDYADVNRDHLIQRLFTARYPWLAGT